MPLTINRVAGAEVVHYYDSTTTDCVFSTGNRFTVRWQSFGERRFSLPLNSSAWKGWLGGWRLLRRLLRLDMASVAVNFERDGLIILYQGLMHFYCFASGDVRKVGSLEQGRCVLSGGIAVSARGMYFGEYADNPARRSVPIWRSQDGGRSWQVVYRFPEGSIKHVHGVFADSHSDAIWVTTGDFSNECFLFEANEDFTSVRRHGDGTQPWRAVNLAFERDTIFWGMDSQLETSRLQRFIRATGVLEPLCEFPGPVWYIKRLTDGWSLLQTTCETGPGVKTNFSHMLASRNLVDWHEIGRFRKDRWPKSILKYGVITFADGPQTMSDFVFSCQALVGRDGQAFRASVDVEPASREITGT